MVSIAAFQAVDPGSIPGRRNDFVLVLVRQQLWKLNPEMLDFFHIIQFLSVFTWQANKQTLIDAAHMSLYS